MEIRKERTWCEACTAPPIPREQVPLIMLFLAALPAWRVSGGMTPVLMEGFDRAELAALIDHAELPPDCSPRTAYGILLEMEADYRQVRAAKTATAPTSAPAPSARRQSLLTG